MRMFGTVCDVGGAESLTIALAVAFVFWAPFIGIAVARRRGRHRAWPWVLAGAPAAYLALLVTGATVIGPF